MQQQTAIDVLVEAGTSVGTALASPDRPGGVSETLVVGTLLVLAAGPAPVLGVLLVGYVVVSAREYAADAAGSARIDAVSGFDDWPRLAFDGLRATAVLVAASLPAAGVLVGVGALGGGEGLLATANGAFRTVETPGVVDTVAAFAVLAALFVLAAAAWHCFVAGVVAVAWASDRPESAVSVFIRFARSAAVRRLSVAPAGLGLAAAVVRFGLGAVPLIGTVLAATATFYAIALASRLLGRVVAAESARTDRLATDIGTTHVGGDSGKPGQKGSRSDRSGCSSRSRAGAGAEADAIRRSLRRERL
jgi:hypothetical protein